MTDPPDEAERRQASSRGDANERVAVVATLKPGSRERAARSSHNGAPYGIDRSGFRRHSVFLAEETVVFLFEGPGIEDFTRPRERPRPLRRVRVLAPLLDGTPALAREEFSW